ncbi:hypothetical protein CMQ_6161 [Grosmannia clavigera kw1407]|uniref:Uncharacterized protein n=1 Tax=Grosmannia clavigera (strain kw1407 / UAMH 11150) TaxID=655863 RepID=F0XME0_GROCL|nr:uncharacterized protein CMQ_6161 [Grosmannia clavigera kw1407]EFX01219.1 hypothetical protein CMQ_6161 [Grosmannia clavigera kw1407]
MPLDENEPLAPPLLAASFSCRRAIRSALLPFTVRPRSLSSFFSSGTLREE